MDTETAWIEDRSEGAATIKKFANDWGSSPILNRYDNAGER